MRSQYLAGLTLLSVVGVSSVYAGDDLDQINDLAQNQFEALSEDLGSALAYRSVAPAEPLGVTGFDVGVSITATKLESIEAWETAIGDNDVSSSLYLPKVHAVKGLPWGIDIGAFYTSVPSSNIKVVGGEVKYAIWEGGVASPALAIRGSYAALQGVDQLDFSTAGVDLSISKGIAMFTPYAGIGVQRLSSEPQEDAGLVLEKESITQKRIMAGLNVGVALFNAAFEFDQIGEATSYSVKVGLRF